MNAELVLSVEREATLVKELGRYRAECCELQTKLSNAIESASKAKKAAREALIDMAEQNAKLVAAYVEKKREVKQLQSAAKEDRRLWQQRLQKMEQELQANKLHITALMQQLHSIAAKQAVAEQSTPASSQGRASAPEQSTTSDCSPINVSFVSSYESSSTSTRDCSPAEVTSRTPPPPKTGLSPLADATNTFNSKLSNAAKSVPAKPSRSRWESSVPFENTSDLTADTPTATCTPVTQKPQRDQALARDQEQQQPLRQQQQNDREMHSRLLQRLAECSSAAQQAANSLGLQQKHEATADTQQEEQPQESPQHQPLHEQQQAVTQQHLQQQQQEAEQQRQLTEQLQREQQQKEQQLLDLQQRTKQLEAENAALRAAQADAEALKDRVQRMQEAEQLKQRGNRHYQSQQYKQAYLSYSEALALSVEDPTFNAVLLCNRAAALHSLGKYLEAIADCCMAAQLDEKYPRVLQRRAEAYMAIEDYSSAVADLQRLVELNDSSKEAAQKLKDAQQKQRAQGTAGPNYYLVLGLQQGCSTAEVKAAYKKLALRYHPDKASGGAYAKASAEAVFVLITAANSVLSDPAKRAAYDATQQALRLKLSMSSRTSGLARRDSSSNSSGGMYNWHYPQAGFGGSYAAAAGAAKAAAAAAATAAAAAEQARWRNRDAHSRHASHGYGGSTSRDTTGSNSSCSSGATYPASKYAC